MDLQHENRVAIALAEVHNTDLIEANKLMSNARIWLIAGESIRESVAQQIAFLTTLNIAQRVFLGGVNCLLPSAIPNLLKLKSVNFTDLATKYGGSITDKYPDKSEIKILFGVECYDENCIEATSSGWRGGVNFFEEKRVIFENAKNPVSLGPVAAASLACYFAFCKIFRVNEMNFGINTGISLWNLNSASEWYLDKNDGPQQPHVPRNVWALGLGHLGQAYLWTLGLMPIDEPSKVLFLLQDDDIVGEENIGSQVLCSNSNIGFPKTRACLQFLESLDFKTQIIEKRFLSGNSEENWIKSFPFLLNGVDNTETRKSINKNNLKLFLDGATNGSSSLFDSFTLKNVTRIDKEPNLLWPKEEKSKPLHKNLYDRYEKENKCGIITNIGVSVPFVGLFGSVFIISELLRAVNQGRIYSIVSLMMRDLSSINAVELGTYDKELLRFSI
ncbi:MAG TPA: ThiF family adenylyltransferase [Bacteroidales bacterium]|nr:ThiF family adenylyltransferase [Bacteroidales bacterium]